MSTTQGKLWTRPFITLAIVNFFSILTFFLLTVKTTEFAINQYGVSHDIAGLAVSIYIFSALAMRLTLGKKLDAWGAQKALLLGCICNATASLLYLAPLNFGAFLVARVIHGASMALVTTSAAAGVALIVPSERVAEGIGYFTLSQALATGLGPFIGILLAEASGGYTAMFMFTAFTGIASLVTYFFVKIPSVTNSKNAEHADAGASADADTDAEHADAGAAGESAASTRTAESATSSRAKNLLGEFVQLSALPLCSCMLLTFVCYSGILGFLTVYASDKGLGEAVSLYFVVYSAVILISRPPMGRLVDRKGENSAMYVSLLTFAASFAVLAFANNGFTLLLSGALCGFGNGITQAVIQAVIARITPPEQLGRANSTLFLCMDAGSGIGPVIIGALIVRAGYSPTFLILAVVALLAMATYHLNHGRKPIARRREGIATAEK